MGRGGSDGKRLVGRLKGKGLSHGEKGTLKPSRIIRFSISREIRMRGERGGLAAVFQRRTEITKSKNRIER